jgi:hypothetical protein
MGGKMKKIIVLVFISFFLVFSSCKKAVVSEEILPKANLTINLSAGNSVILYWNYQDVYSCSGTVIITETNGVGGYITNAKLEFANDTTGYYWGPFNYLGKHFVPYESWAVSSAFLLSGINQNIYPTRATITISGTDDNEHSFSFTKTWSVTYQ